MKLICITGRSGSGKSEFGEKLRCALGDKKTLFLDIDYISSAHIKGRTYSEDAMKNHFSRQLETEIQSDEQYAELFRKGRKLTEKLDDPLYLCIESTIDSILQETDAEYVILDWIWLPKTKYFDNCDYRVLVKAISNRMRIERILGREREDKRNETRDAYYRRLFLREKYALNYDLYDYNIVIHNDYGVSDVFDESIKTILDKIGPIVR